LTGRFFQSIIEKMFRRIFFLFLLLTCAVLALGGSSLPPGDQVEHIRAFTRSIEFDYITWTLDALGVKLGQFALGSSNYIPADSQSQLAIDYLKLISDMNALNSQIQVIYADPNTANPEQESAALRKNLESLEKKRSELEPLAEAVLQDQLSTTAAHLGLTLGGQPVPPVLYHTTPPPDALIVSPRHVIRQDADISIKADLTIDQITKLEENVDRKMNVSSLVVGIGGIGLYPTMVMQTSDINWLTEVVAHEWVHNFLTLRPLGFSYLSTPELRIMNETAASIAGKEIGRAVVAQYYPQYLPPPSEPDGTSSEPGTQTVEPDRFDFRQEMRTTRVTVDQLLSEGKIDAAENYMEERRRLFWDNGYLIRKLNQAYFAFYGAYADQEGGASGTDPVGTAVRALRAESPDLASFLNRISWMWSFDQLKKTTLLENQ
jgi:hypothetical protein